MFTLFRARWFLCGMLCARMLALSWLLDGANVWFAVIGEEVPRSVLVSLGSSRAPGFSQLPGVATGIQFKNVVPESRHLTNGILLNGTGIAAGDVDGDGRCDLYFCRTDGTNALYRNLGNWRFEEITRNAGVGCDHLTSTGAVFADLDGDGDLDLVVNTIGNGTRIFRNDGKGSFTQTWVLNRGVAGMTTAVADVDGDGFLDLYIANHRPTALMDYANARFTFRTVHGTNEVETVNGRPTTDPDLADRFVSDGQGGIFEWGVTDVLLKNQGGTNWTVLPFTGGTFLDENGIPMTKAPQGWALCAAFHDLNGDGLPDLYVCHDFLTEDICWINQGNGKFRRLPSLALRKMPMSSMAVDFADINRDGAVDFLALDMMSRSHRDRMLFLKERPPSVHTPGLMANRPQYEMNTLFLNRGDSTFAEIAQLSGLEAADWAWSCAFLDVDLDGWEDVLVVNGMERAGRDQDVAEQIRKLRATRRLSDAEVYQARRMYPRLATPNLAFRNRGDLTFVETGQAWGFATKGVSTSMALADLDNDGDLDVVVGNINDPAGVYRNESTAPRLGIRLMGLPPNTRGIGARIRVTGGAVPEQSQEVISGGRYLSGDDGLRSFAAGSLTNRMTVEVMWRSGRVTRAENLQPNHIYELAESVSVSATTRSTHSDPPWFVDHSEVLSHSHHQEVFDDFARQPLLPNRLSQLGPGLSWFDLDGDGHDDLILGTGRGGTISGFLGDGRGGFKPVPTNTLGSALDQDVTTLLGTTAASGKPELLVGLANYSAGAGLGVSVRQIQPSNSQQATLVGPTQASTGPMALADLTGTGSLSLFVGGRVIAGRYPQAADSLVLKKQGDLWLPDSIHTAVLKEVGLVSGAVFSDLDGDGLPELLLACEWGPIRVFQNQKGVFQDATARLGLIHYLGWWNGVTTGDFDGDGRLDIAASNWGRNTKYQSHRERPLMLFYGDFAGNSSVGLLEAHWESQIQKWVPERQLNPLAEAFPFLREKFNSHRAFSMAGVEEVLGDRFSQAKSLSANWLESTVFLNRGDHFEARALPVEAQMAPAFGITVGDVDGDGREDLFLAQNFFDAQAETPRYDGGRGLWLRGDGHGGFQAVDGTRTGVRIYGEQRGAALADFDEDGRIDLAVTQNGGATRLYRNQMARPGIRIRLQGPPGNPQGLGAVVSLIMGQTQGPAHEVHAGSGYWSQDSSTVVLGAPTDPSAVRVRWPGGKVTQIPLPVGGRSAPVVVSWQP